MNSIAVSMNLIIVVGFTFLLAGFVKGVIGLGLPTVAVGLLSLVMSPMVAASLLLIPSLVTNIWQLWAGGNCCALLRRLWLMLLGIVVGTCWGGILLAGQMYGEATMALGIALIVYALLGLSVFQLKVPLRGEVILSPVIGVLTGFVTAATSVFVVPAVPYLQALQLEKEELIQALGLSFTVSTLALGVNLMSHHVLSTDIAGISLLALLPALVGMLIGQRARKKLSPILFRRCFFIGMLMLGMHLAVSR